MSQVEQLDLLVEVFDSSAKLIREHLRSETANGDVSEPASHAESKFPLSSAPENVKDANKSMFEAMTKIHQMFTDPVELWTLTTINVSDRKGDLSVQSL